MSINNIHTPKQIIEKINKLNLSSIEFTTNDLNNNYGRVSIGPIHGMDNEDNYGHINGKSITFYDFMLLWDDLIFAAKDWINNNCGDQIDLNI